MSRCSAASGTTAFQPMREAPWQYGGMGPVRNSRSNHKSAKAITRAEMAVMLANADPLSVEYMRIGSCRTSVNAEVRESFAAGQAVK